MAEKSDVKQGTLALMILKTLDVLGPLHGYGIARRIEETSKNRLTLNYGTLDRKSTRLNSSHVSISYAVFCLKKKKYTSFSLSPTLTASWPRRHSSIWTPLLA